MGSATVPRRKTTRVASVLVLAVVVAAVPAARREAPVPAELIPFEVVMPDSGRTVSDLVRVVAGAAGEVPGSRPLPQLDIVFTDEIPEADGEPLVGGWQRGSTVSVRIGGNAMPTRVLLHELAHAATPGAGHDGPFRDVYLAAVAEVYDEATASREHRRLAWVYDGCYRDDTCPELVRAVAPHGRRLSASDGQGSNR
jgi:hypothetical protein